MVDDNAVPRGLTAIIKVRRLWVAQGLISCRQQETGSTDCCAIHLLESQADFQNHNSLLEKICLKFSMIFKNIQNCECNYIERGLGRNDA